MHLCGDEKVHLLLNRSLNSCVQLQLCTLNGVLQVILSHCIMASATGVEARVPSAMASSPKESIGGPVMHLAPKF